MINIKQHNKQYHLPPEDVLNTTSYYNVIQVHAENAAMTIRARHAQVNPIQENNINNNYYDNYFTQCYIMKKL